MNSNAARVLQIKNEKILIDLEDEGAYVGDKFYTLDENNKRKSVVKILQIKNNKAVASVVKGIPKVGHQLLFATISQSEPQREVATDSTDSTLFSSRAFAPQNAWGLSTELIMGQMKTSFKGYSSGDIKSSLLVGTNWGFGGFAQYEIGADLFLQVQGLYEKFELKGNTTESDCQGSDLCSVNFSYLSAYGDLKYYLTVSSPRFWIALGGGTLIPFQKESNILSTSNTSMNVVFHGALGGDYVLHQKAFIPASIEYNYFPNSSTVQSSMISLKIGYGMNF